MNSDPALPIGADAPAPLLSAGGRLREARAQAGLTIDAVAQQLKLAPRQVRALEDDDFAQLPGRTFVRGFMRNYSRLVHLDPDDVLATLPDAIAAPSLDHPSLNSTSRVMGELPADMPGKPSTARWAIPLALLAIVAIGVLYEYARPLAEQIRAVTAGKSVAPPAATTPPPAPVATDTAPTAPTTETVVPAANAPVDTAAVNAPAQPAGETPLVLVFRGTSWVEIKDAKGAIVLSTIGYPGASHAVGGVLPLEVVLGNAEVVTVTWRGAAFDVTQHTKQNVAKFSIR